jgi:hypothetical protein
MAPHAPFGGEEACPLGRVLGKKLRRSDGTDQQKEDDYYSTGLFLSIHTKLTPLLSNQ